MPTNFLTTFANGVSANLPVETTWQGLTERATGFQTGLARSDYFNRLFAQGAVGAYVIGKLVVDYANQDATLSGSTLYTNFKTALPAFLSSSFLPLSGGTMTGAISKQNNVVNNTVDSGYTSFWGASTSTDGAILTLTGKDNTTYSGAWMIRAGDSVNTATLQGTPTGSLNWNGREVERVHNTSGKYIKLDSGLLICYGIGQFDSTGSAVTFDVDFKDNNEPVVFLSPQNTATTASYSSRSKSGFTLKTSSGSAVWVSWLAIGRWK